MSSPMEKFVKIIKDWKSGNKAKCERIGGFYVFFYQEKDGLYTIRTKMIKKKLKAGTCYKLFKKVVSELNKLTEQEFLSLLKYGSLKPK